MTTALATQSHVPAELQEKVLLGGDLAKLTPTERLSYYNAVCTSVGLNPLTRPFEYLILNEKMVLYARKDCTDQLRDLHGISVEIASREVIDGVCVVTARAKNMTERIDESVGAVPFMKEDGDWKQSSGGKSYFAPNGSYKPLGLADRANAMMKAETKAKRRVTLSICGLGMFDESEIDGVPDAKKLYHAEETEPAPSVKPSDILALSEERREDNDLQGAAPAPSAESITADYFEKIALAESLRELSGVLNQALKNQSLSIFENRQVQDAGQKKMAELKGGKT